MKLFPENVEYCLKLKFYKGVGDKTAHDLLRVYETPQEAYHSLKPQLAVEERYQHELNLIERYQAQVLIYSDKAYPNSLKNMDDEPLLLYVLGQLDALKGEHIAVVGSRYPSTHALLKAEKLGQDLARSSVGVVSGLARGIDAAAHRGVVKQGGITLAVLGSGLLHLSPQDNRHLADEIQNKGCVISEFPMDMKASVGTFPRRNRLISGLASRGVIVVEGSTNSGALITANYAKEQGRCVYAMPGLSDIPKTSGNHELLRQGARFLEKASDLEGLPTSDEGEKKVAMVSLNDQEQFVFDLIDSEPRYIHDLYKVGKKKGLTLPELASILTILELKGVVRQFSGQKFMKV